MKNFFLAFVILVVITSSFFLWEEIKEYQVTRGSSYAMTPTARSTLPGWISRHRAIVNRVKQGNVDLIMIGDSIMYNWEHNGKEIWKKNYVPRNVLNLGFNGDRTQNVLWRLNNGEIFGINPKLAILLIGTNNVIGYTSKEIADGIVYTSKDIANGIVAICQILRDKLPNTKILILAIFPQAQDEAHMPRLNIASKIISKIADDKFIYYLDLNNKFLDSNGVLTKEIMFDFVHLTPKGYSIWAEAMEPTVKKLMGE